MYITRKTPTRIYENHGRYGTPEYISWGHMLSRCRNKNRKDYPRYGGRGIKVCASWHGFTSFYKDMGDRPKGRYSLDRINNSGNYSCGHCEECVSNGWPMNCRWADDFQQSVNKRVYSNSRTGHKNVKWSKVCGAWAVVIERQNVTIYSAYFSDIADAIKARDMVLRVYDSIKSTEPKYYKNIMSDVRRSPRPAFGENNPSAKLDRAAVRKIREVWLNTGMYQWQIAERFAVGQGTVSRIILNRSWVDNNYNPVRKTRWER